MKMLVCQGDCPSKQVIEWGLRHDTIFVRIYGASIQLQINIFNTVNLGSFQHAEQYCA
jgi:hypothetical protein